MNLYRGVWVHMASEISFDVTHALKNAFKAKGKTYREVAQTIGVSEQTIKRLFREKDCSISRLQEICLAIGISIYDLFNLAQNYSETTARLSSEQELYLAEHPSHFSVLYLLTLGYSAEDIRQQYRLTELGIFRYLRELEKEGFLDLREHNKFYLTFQEKLLFPLDSPLHKRIRELNKTFLDYVVSHFEMENHLFASNFRFMSKGTLDDLQQDLSDLTKKYRQRSYQDEALLPREKLLGVKWLTLTAPYDLFGRLTIDVE